MVLPRLPGCENGRERAKGKRSEGKGNENGRYEVQVRQRKGEVRWGKRSLACFSI